MSKQNRLKSRLVVTAWLVALACVFIAFSAKKALAEEGPEELIGGKEPIASQGVKRIKELTDGRVATEGDFWLTNLTTVFANDKAYAIYDLGGPQPIRCIFLQGDNNDSYQVDGSINGDKFFPMYIGMPTEGAGMRQRFERIVATARFVRVHAHGGDGSYSLSELSVLRHCPSPWPPQPARTQGIEITDNLMSWLVVGAILVTAVVGLVTATRRGKPPQT
jgi:hypothetical protein